MDDDHHDRRFPPAPPSPLCLSYSNWSFFSHGQAGEEEEWRKESVDRVKQALFDATWELESTRLAAQEQIHRMECEVARLRDLLRAVTRERDEAREHVHHALLLLDKGQSLVFLQNSAACGVTGPVTTPWPPANNGRAASAQLPPPDLVENNNVTNSAPGVGVSSSSSLSSEESSVIVSSSPAMPPAADVELFELVPVGKLPEKGKLFEAVMKAGPLLQNLMLAGPLPQWRHPPPPLRSFEIPPVSISMNSTATAAATTATCMTMAEDTKPTYAHHQSLFNGKKRGMEAAAATADVCGQSPPSSSSSSPKSNSSYKCQKIGPVAGY